MIFALPARSVALIFRHCTGIVMSIASIVGSSSADVNALSATPSLERASDPFSAYLQRAVQPELQSSGTAPASTSLDRLRLIASQLDTPDINLADLKRQAE